MPELPEVETIVRELRQKLRGDTFTGLKVYWTRTFVKEKKLEVSGQKIKAVERKGKYIIFRLSAGWMITHLRMTGQLIVDDRPADNRKHLRLSFSLASGRYLQFYDMRKFGRIYLTADEKTILVNTGLDALDARFTENYLKELLKNRSTRIKSFLLDQKYIAGLGNIYIDESLFLAGIHPEMPAGKLGKNRVKKLYEAIQLILAGAIENMGTTLSDYRTTGGGFGSNQYYLKVYGREEQSCLVCKTVIKKIRHAGRGTHFCPTCQPLVL